jgi:NADH-quinone oxidoreductase subunit J
MAGFFILAVLITLGALGVILLREPVHAALALVGTLLALAVTYVTLDAHFLAAIQVIVYTGAIMVLFLFVIMLLNVRETPAPARFPWLRPAAYLVGLGLAATVILTALLEPQQLPSLQVIGAALNGGAPAQIGEIIFTDYVLAFQLVGILLLTGIIGAVSLVQRIPAAGTPADSVPAETPQSERQRAGRAPAGGTPTENALAEPAPASGAED